MLNFVKHGLIYCPGQPFDWWQSHAMAPAPVFLGDRIRVFLGAWDKYGISRIAAMDLDADDPAKILEIFPNPVLDIGPDGTFDENGVFPGHAAVIDQQVRLYYTGFQLGAKIRYYNFGGLATGSAGDKMLTRISNAPVLDRSDEGLCVRAGQSVLYENGIFRTVYSAGSLWVEDSGKARPCYDVFYQESPDGIRYEKAGRKIISSDLKVEHGLGRPQLFKLDNAYYVIYTRRVYNMKYFFGVASSPDLKTWTRIDDDIRGMDFSAAGWDSEMIYFPAILATGKKIFLFYSGNDFGKTGFGFAELII